MIVELTAEAERDLEKVGDWIAGNNPAVAERFVNELLAACLALADFPERFPLVPRYERHRIRHRVHGNYLIFYRVESDKVVAVHVLHGAMDYSGLLLPG